MSEKDWLIALWVCFIVTNLGLINQFNETNKLIKEVKIDCSKRK